MNKLLVGVVFTETAQKRNVLNLIARFLNLLHHSIETPIYDAIAIATGADKCALMLEPQPHKLIPLCEATELNLHARINWALSLNNENFLLDALKQSLLEKSKDNLHSLFNGFLISDLRKKSHVEYIRKNHGVVVHVKHSNSKLPHPIQPDKSDIIIILENSTPVEAKKIFHHCEQIKAQFKNEKKVAA